MRKIDIILKNSGGGILQVETAVVMEGSEYDESDVINEKLLQMMADGMLIILPGDTLEFVERD